MAAITIDRDTRNAVRDRIRWDATDFEVIEHALNVGDRDEAQSQQAKLGLFMDLLDGLGWAQEDDRPDYEVTVDPEEFRTWLAAKRRECAEMVGEDTVVLLRQEAGDEGYYFDSSTQSESISKSRKMIESNGRVAATFQDLLYRLATVEAVA